MTFLNPFVLIGLAAASIPILIHLWNKRKLRTIEFSTLSFLKELQKNRMRKITIRQWLLLLLRTLIIIFLVLAFSRPALHGSFGPGSSHAASSIAVILDNSASMELTNERGKFLTQAQDEALRIVSLLQENDDAYFLPLSDLSEKTVDTPTHDIGKLTRLIRETGISYSYHTIDEALQKAAVVLSQSKNLNKEIYIITDGQRSTLERKTLPSRRVMLPQGTKVFYTFLSGRQAENFSVEQVVIPPSIILPGKPLSVLAVVKNNGTSVAANHMVSLSMDGHRVAQRNATLAPGETKTLDFSVTPEGTGFVEGYVQSEDDAFEADNKRYFTIYVPQQVRALLVASDDAHSKYISTALSLASGGAGSTPVTLTAIRPNQLTSNLLNANDVFIFSGIADIADSYYPIVQQRLQNGGSLLFFPSSDSVNGTYPLLSRFGIVSNGFVRSPGASFSTIEKVDYDFPIFNGMFESYPQHQNSIETPAVNLTLSVLPSRTVQPIITLSNGNPLMWKKNTGSGLILGFSVPASTDWSDLPLKGLFVPLLYQSMLYLTSYNTLTTAASDVVVGTSYEFSPSVLRLGDNVSPEEVKAYDENKRYIPVVPASGSNGGNGTRYLYSINAIDHPGIYTVTYRQDTVLAIAANIPNEESEGALADDQGIENVVERFGLHDGAVIRIQPGENIQDIVLQSRFGTELWKYFLLLAAITALIEMFVAREKKEL